MRKFILLFALKIIILASSAVAQITPTELIALWKSDFEQFGITLSFDETVMENGGIALSNFEFSAAIGIESSDGFAIEGVANDVTLEPKQDGSVAVEGLSKITVKFTSFDNAEKAWK